MHHFTVLEKNFETHLDHLVYLNMILEKKNTALYHNESSLIEDRLKI